MKNPISLILILILTLTFAGCQPQVAQKVKESVSKVTQKETEKDPYADWQIFENQKHKFSFKYPAGWELSENVDRPDLYTLTLSRKDISQEKVMVYTEEMDAAYSINISVEPNTKGFSAEESYLDMFGESSKAKAKEGIEEVTFGGVTGIKYPEFAAPSSGPATGILIAHNEKLYRFVYGALAHQETHEKYLPEFMDILKTLKFLD